MVVVIGGGGVHGGCGEAREKVDAFSTKAHHDREKELKKKDK